MTLWMMKSLHHWFGIAFAAFFFILALSGVWLTLASYSAPSLFKTEFRAPITALSPAQTGAAITTIQDAYPDLTQIDFPYKGKAVFAVHRPEQPIIYLSQTGFAPIGTARQTPLTDSVRRVHITLLDPFGIGKEAVVWTGLVGAFLAGLGAVLFVFQPRTFRKDRVLAPREMSFRDIRRSHVSSGIVFAVFVIFFGLTGFAIGDREAANSIVHSIDESVLAFTNTASAPLPLTTQAQIDIADLAMRARAEMPDRQITRLTLGVQENPLALKIDLKGRSDINTFGHSQLIYHLQSGEVIYRLDGAELGRGALSLSNAFTLHGGRGMGIVYQILLCALGVMTGILALTGLLSYILKWRQKLRGLARRRAARARAKTVK